MRFEASALRGRMLSPVSDERHESAADEADPFPERPLDRFFTPRATFVLTRFLLLRLLGFVYFVAFLCSEREAMPLWGKRGLLPIAELTTDVLLREGSRLRAFRVLPTLFWAIGSSDTAIEIVLATGVVLSLSVALGVTNAWVMTALWALYLSFTNVGQVFTGYGWEIQLVETGFLAIFLCPSRSLHPFPKTPPHALVLWLFRWLIVRIMLGAGLIKLRGDACWRDFTCLVYHYETQPVPSPVSWLLHQAPRPFHVAGVAVNHLVEIVAPFFAFGPKLARHVAGSAFIAFQIFLIVSGNLSFLNWLTIVPAIACFDDDALRRVLPARLVAMAERRTTEREPSRRMRWASLSVGLVVAILSIDPIANLVSSQQSMNQSFNPLHLVNTYGAFGSVNKERFEVVLQGTSAKLVDERTKWIDYELPCKPGDVVRRPCVITPYHHRLDWQMWFLPGTRPAREGWFLHLVQKILQGDKAVAPLFARDPFPSSPPKYVRAALFRYEFTRAGDGSGAWWRRTEVGEYLRPVSLEDGELDEVLRAYGWVHDDAP